MLQLRKKEGGFPVSFFFPPGTLTMLVKAISHRAVFSIFKRENSMDKFDKQAMQVAKEVIIKFIEVGRISPSNFGQHFDVIYKDIIRTISGETAGDGSREAELAGKDK